jgi:hypothetical protein
MKYLLLFTLFCSAALLSATEKTPIISWNFDQFENHQSNAVSGSYTATAVRPEQVRNVQGKSGSAIHIGGQYKGSKAGALIVRNFKFDFTNPFTTEIVVRFDPLDKKMPQREIFSITDAERGPGIRFQRSYNSLQVLTGDGKKISAVKTDRNAHRISSDTWHLLTVTSDGTELKIYYDGIPAAAKTIKILPAQKNKNLSIGSYKNGMAYPLRGALDELSFYDFCKTPIQVAERYLSLFGE